MASPRSRGRTHTRGRRLPFLAAALALALLGAACSSSSGGAGGGGGRGGGTGSPAAGGLQPITVSVSGANGNDAPIFVGLNAGVFKKYGLDLSVKVLTPTASSAAVASGTVDIGGDGPNMVAAVLASKNGAKVIFTNGVTAFFVAAASSVHSLADLKGKTVAATTPGGGADTALRTALKANHITPDKDVKIVYLSQNSASLAALAAGRVQGAVVSPPTVTEAQNKYHLKTFDIGNYVLPSVYAVSGGFASKHPDLVQKFTRGYMAATRLAKRDKKTSEAAFKKYIKITDQAQLDGTWQQYIHRWAAAPFPPHLMKELLAGLKPPSTADPNSVIDNSYVNKIPKSEWVIAS